MLTGLLEMFNVVGPGKLAKVAAEKVRGLQMSYSDVSKTELSRAIRLFMSPSLFPQAANQAMLELLEMEEKEKEEAASKQKGGKKKKNKKKKKGQQARAQQGAGADGSAATADGCAQFCFLSSFSRGP